MRSYEEIIKIITSFLNKHNIPYMVVGATAVSIYGNPRTSMDIDFLIVLGDKIKDFVNFLKENNFDADIKDIKIAFKEKSHSTIFDNLSVFRLDIKGVYTQFDKESLERRRVIKVKNTKINLCSPEDLILCKLDFGSEQDLNDARSILLRQKNLDLNYLKKKSKKMKIFDKLKNLLEEIKQRKLQ